jgi:hypothetical protein
MRDLTASVVQVGANSYVEAEWQYPTVINSRWGSIHMIFCCIAVARSDGANWLFYKIAAQTTNRKLRHSAMAQRDCASF